MKKFQSFDGACKHLKISTELPDVSNLPEDMQKSVIAQYKLQILVKAHNGDWKPNYGDSSQWKYFPFFYYRPGSGWSYDDYVSAIKCACVGARLALN